MKKHDDLDDVPTVRVITQDEKKKLKSFIDRISRLKVQKKDLDDEINELTADAADKMGLRKSTIKALAKRNRMSEIERQEADLLQEELEQCQHALGMLAGTPLGDAAEESTKKGTSKKVRKLAEEAGATI